MNHQAQTEPVCFIVLPQPNLALLAMEARQTIAEIPFTLTTVAAQLLPWSLPVSGHMNTDIISTISSLDRAVTILAPTMSKHTAITHLAHPLVRKAGVMRQITMPIVQGATPVVTTPTRHRLLIRTSIPVLYNNDKCIELVWINENPGYHRGFGMYNYNIYLLPIHPPNMLRSKRSPRENSNDNPKMCPVL